MNDQRRMRAGLSAPGLYSLARNCFKRIKDIRRETSRIFSLDDSLMAGLAIFSLKFPSLLQFDQSRESDKLLQSNLKNLFNLDQIPSDTRLREILDPIESRDLRKPFTAIFANLQRGKALEPYQFYKGSVLISIDGTGYFSSDTVHCANCCSKVHRDGKITYYHQLLGAALVHPDQSVVIPLAPEPIIKQDGSKKNDCERNASQRMLRDLRREHPHLDAIIIEDGLASNSPHIRLLRELKYNFILGAKPGDHAYLFHAIDDAAEHGPATIHEEVKGGTIYRYQFINDVPLSAAEDAVRINFLRYYEIVDGKIARQFSWVTDYQLSVNNVEKIMRGGRARWKIENETFNTLKNQGYQFEHNFGHGNQNLSTNFAMLMMLAFLIDQAQALCCKVFQAAAKKEISKKSLWEKMRATFFMLPLESWDQLWAVVAYGHQVTGFTVNTS
jgi:hypothetical protein